MRIAHLMLANFYIEGYGYQENLLPKMNKKDGHEVIIIASTETYSDGKITYTQPMEYTNEDGIRVFRVPYRKIMPHRIMVKIRGYKGVYELLKVFKPDVIFFHGLVAHELMTVVKYKKDYPQTKLYADSHADYSNSAQKFFSKHILHKLFYRTIVQNALPYIERVYCVSIGTQDFVKNMYGVTEEKSEFYPLGGEILAEEEYKRRRNLTRERMKLKEDDILFVHSGKMDKLKRTPELLEAFTKVKVRRFKLIIAGVILKDIAPQVKAFIAQDDRIEFVGWKNKEELTDLLCAADMYLQPGGQSVTMQNAMCSRCALMLYPFPNHEPYLKGNGFFVNRDEAFDELERVKEYKGKEFIPDEMLTMVQVFRKIDESAEELEKMKSKSLQLAKEMLDYEILSQKYME